jgi:hypothetical protein
VSDVAQALRRIRTWMSSRTPELATAWASPAGTAAMKALEGQLGETLGPSLRGLLSITDGTSVPVVEQWRLLSVTEIAARHSARRDEKGFQSRWIPFATDGGDGLLLCDANSDEVRPSHGQGKKPAAIAADIGSFLLQYAHLLEDGSILPVEDAAGKLYGLVRRKEVDKLVTAVPGLRVRGGETETTKDDPMVGTARKFVELLLKADKLALVDADELEGVARAIAPALHAKKSDAARSREISAILLDHGGVDELFVDEDTLELILRQW